MLEIKRAHMTAVELIAAAERAARLSENEAKLIMRLIAEVFRLRAKLRYRTERVDYVIERPVFVSPNVETGDA